MAGIQRRRCVWDMHMYTSPRLATSRHLVSFIYLIMSQCFLACHPAGLLMYQTVGQPASRAYRAVARKGGGQAGVEGMSVKA